MKKVILSLSILFALAACKSNTEEDTLTYSGGSSIEAEGQSEEVIRENLEKIEAEKARTTTLSYDRLKHDFGKVKADSDNLTSFKVTNTGDNPLIISDVKASCGCTTPKKPEKPILPGESDIIEVNFHPNPGQGEVTKTVTVTANTDPRISELEIKASVQD